jgi:transcriptional regulator with XRE-family HTH domain
MQIYTDNLADEELNQKIPMVKALGKRLRSIRIASNQTQEQVAERAGINSKYLGEIERGRKCPTAVVLQKLSVALNTPICGMLPKGSFHCARRGLPDEAVMLFSGKSGTDVSKALRILKVLFE